MRRRAPLALLALCAGCPANTVTTPTRSLDRPSDVALVCARIEESGRARVLPLDRCAPQSILDNDVAAGPAAGTAAFSTRPQLYLLVSNTNRGEVATGRGGKIWPDNQMTLDDAIDGGSSVLDLDPHSPGFGFIPVGALPQALRASDDGCVAVTANEGDCSMSVIDVPRALQAAACRSLGGNTHCDGIAGQPLSSLVRGTLAPHVGGRPIGARPTAVELAPGAGAGVDGGMAVECGPPGAYRAIVAFPGCQLVAEVDLDSGAILRGLRVDRAGARVLSDGELATLQCPQECRPPVGTVLDLGPSAVDLGPPDLAAPDPSDMAAPGADDGGAGDGGAEDAGQSGPDLGLPPLFSDAQAWPHTLAVGDLAGRPAFFVGDATSSRITFVEIEPAGAGADGGVAGWSVAGGVALEGGVGGVARLRTVRVARLGAIRYLYAIARDNTVRVVDVDRQTECETNPTPDAVSAALVRAGVPVDVRGADAIRDDLRQALTQGTDGLVGAPWKTPVALRCLPVGSTARDPLAATAGVSLPGGALPRDVAFVLGAPRFTPPASLRSQEAPPAAPGVLFGDFAWIVDSAGRALALNLSDLCPQPNFPLERSQEACNPQRFGDPLPSTDTFDAGEAAAWRQPEVSGFDVMPNRLRAGVQRFLQPANLAADANGGARLADYPLSGGSSTGTVGDANRYLTRLCAVPPAGQGCATPGQEGSTRPGAVTLIPQIDFRRPPGASVENWRFAWEGTLPGTTRTSGSLQPNGPIAGIARPVGHLRDAAAALCGRGVRPGDKVSLLGCSNNDQCGPDQVCWLDPASPVRTALCVLRRDSSKGSTPDPFVTSGGPDGRPGCQPWSVALLRYRVVRAGPFDAWFEELPLPEHPIETHPCAGDADCADVQITTTIGNSAPVMLATRCLPDGHGQTVCLRACDPIAPEEGDRQCGDGWVCAVSAIDQRPRCLRAPLPPEAGSEAANKCFGEQLRYDVRGGEAFIATSDVNGFLHEDVVDAGGLCRAAPDEGRRRMSGRVPLPAAGYVPWYLAPALACGPKVQASWLRGSIASDGGTTSTCELACQGVGCPDPLAGAQSGPDGGTAAPTCTGDRRCTTTTRLHHENPLFSLVLDVLVRQVKTGPGVTNTGWKTPVPSRAPDDDADLTFRIVGGFRPLAFTVASNDGVAQLPRAAVATPGGTNLYVVDEGRQTTGSGLRGQMIRVQTHNQTSDTTFNVR